MFASRSPRLATLPRLGSVIALLAAALAAATLHPPVMYRTAGARQAATRSGAGAVAAPAYFADWQAAVQAGAAADLRAMYSTQPPMEILVSTGVFDDAQREVNFWAQWHRLGLTHFGVEIIRLRFPGPGLQQVFFQGALEMKTQSGPRTFYLFVAQTWQRQEAKTWRIISGSRTDLSRLRQPNTLAANLFPSDADPRAAIASAQARAQRRHTRVLVVFGANWCYDCHVLDLALHHSDLTPLLEANYEVVDVDVGEFNRNLDVAARYHVPLSKGVPALAVLTSDGHLLYSQQNGEFEMARALSPDDLIRFLNAWKPTR